MTTTKHTYVDPNGIVYKRSSASMRYSHVIVRSTSYWSIRQEVQHMIDMYQGWLETPRQADQHDRFAKRLVELRAELEATPTSGHTYSVVSWSQSAAAAEKRAKSGQFVAPVTSN